MVTEFGMSDLVGPIAYGAEEESVFLGRDFGNRSRDYSETVAKQIDDEVRKFILDAHEQAKSLLTDRRDLLEKIALALLERETLDAEDIDAILMGRDLLTKERVIIPTYADREKAAKEKRRAASIFGAPKPATG